MMRTPFADSEEKETRQDPQIEEPIRSSDDSESYHDDGPELELYNWDNFNLNSCVVADAAAPFPPSKVTVRTSGLSRISSIYTMPEMHHGRNLYPTVNLPPDSLEFRLDVGVTLQSNQQTAVTEDNGSAEGVSEIESTDPPSRLVKLEGYLSAGKSLASSIATTANGAETREAKGKDEEMQRKDEEMQVPQGLPDSNLPCCPHQPHQESNQNTFPGAFAQPGGASAQDVGQTGTSLDSERQTNTVGLVAAMPVEDHNMVEAQPFDSSQREARLAEEKRHSRLACGCFGVATLFLAVSFVVTLVSKEEVSADREAATITSPTSLLPPLENLELLYEDLPEKLRTNLHNSSSPQYKAWEWLVYHPNISNMEEWKKKQLYAMGSFFHSFGGTHWRDDLASKWMDVRTDECSWVLNDDEIAYFAEQSNILIGPAYGELDYHTCNEDGEVQTLFLHRLHLPEGFQPSMPPEIELLTSLKILGIILSDIKGELSDIIVPELMEHPSLSQLNLRQSGVLGSIPSEIGQLTGLKHLLIGGNKLVGSIPSEIANFANLIQLEYLDVGQMSGLTGTIPSELGLLTTLTSLILFLSSMTGEIPTHLGLLTDIRCLDIDWNSLTGVLPTQLGLLTDLDYFGAWRNSLTGPIPTELGLLTNTEKLHLFENFLTGRIPSELGQLTNIIQFSCTNNDLTGSIPSELGLMTNAMMLYLGNDMKVQGTYNNLSGSIPAEIWELSQLEHLYLEGLPLLGGTIPSDLVMPNLTVLNLGGLPQLSGTLPEEICFIQVLEFDCTEMLCGCDCPCLD